MMMVTGIEKIDRTKRRAIIYLVGSGTTGTGIGIVFGKDGIALLIEKVSLLIRCITKFFENNALLAFGICIIVAGTVLGICIIVAGVVWKKDTNSKERHKEKLENDQAIVDRVCETIESQGNINNMTVSREGDNLLISADTEKSDSCKDNIICFPKVKRK